MGDALKGLIIGAFLGAIAGLSVCVWFLTETLLFPGDTMVAGAVICGTCGYFGGDDFFESLKHLWHFFT